MTVGEGGGSIFPPSLLLPPVPPVESPPLFLLGSRSPVPPNLLRVLRVDGGRDEWMNNKFCIAQFYLVCVDKTAVSTIPDTYLHTIMVIHIELVFI